MVLVVLILIIAPISYVIYSYTKMDDVLHPRGPKAVSRYVIVYTPTAQFYTFTEEQYQRLLESGNKPPEGSEIFNVTLESYITGSPEVDLNITLRSFYDYFTIVLGDPSVANCKDMPQLYAGDCKYRTLAVSEISGVVSTIFKTNYYIQALRMGYDNATAKQYAFNQTWLRYRKTYLNFWAKVDLGRGKIGNEKHLAIILIGPAEGAEENRIFAPRKGVLVIEGTTDEILRAEIVLIEDLIGFKWPQGSSPTG